MIEVKITEDMKKRAWAKSREMGVIKNSIMKGDGNIAGFLLPFWFIGRHYIKSKMKYNQFIMNSFLFISFFSNLNAFFYFLPIYIIEFFSFR